MRIPQCRTDVKSDEEWSAVLWLREAVRVRLVEKWEYEPRSFELFPPATFTEPKQLKTKSKTVERCLHRGASYTPDFYITFTDEGRRLMFKTFKKSILSGASAANNEVWIDIKGTFNPNDQPRYFSIIQKAMFHVNGIWVSRIVPFYATVNKKTKVRTCHGLFYETFAPESLRYMKKGPLNSCGRACFSVEQFLIDRQSA